MFQPTYALYWEGLIIGFLAVIPTILVTWRIITPAMRKDVVDWLDRKWVWIKEDIQRDLGNDAPHRRTY